MKKLILNCAAALAVFGMVTSCSQENIAPEIDNVPAEVRTMALNQGYNTQDLTSVDRVNPLSGEREIGYMLEGDMFIPADKVEEVLGTPTLSAPEVEQYRTNNLVSQNRTITIIGFTGSGNALTSKMQTGLQWAVNNYNRLNLSIDFDLTYGTNWQSKDMVVYNNNQSGGGGSAGFPSGGDPFQFVQINAGTNSFSTNVNEHVICHEIGHSIGFRHTDWFDRSFSCGSGGNEGSAGVGAVHIPGTPTGIDANSIMLACFNSGVDGEFSSNDVTALNFLY